MATKTVKKPAVKAKSETAAKTTTKTASTPSKEKAKEHQPTAYNVRTKQKGVPMLEVTISKTSRGTYMAQGVSSDGDKLTTMMSEANAKAAIKAGLAKKDF